MKDVKGLILMLLFFSCIDLGYTTYRWFQKPTKKAVRKSVPQQVH